MGHSYAGGTDKYDEGGRLYFSSKIDGISINPWIFRRLAIRTLCLWDHIQKTSRSNSWILFADIPSQFQYRSINRHLLSQDIWTSLIEIDNCHFTEKENSSPFFTLSYCIKSACTLSIKRKAKTGSNNALFPPATSASSLS